jgi:putative DNA primase/helicase
VAKSRDGKRSFQGRIIAAMTGSGDIVVHSFCGDSWQECRDHVRRELGLPAPEWAATRPRPPRKVTISSAPNKGARVRAIWQESVDIPGTLAEKYIVEERKLTIDQDFGHVLRFHPRCPFKVEIDGKSLTEYAPALIGLMRDVKTDEARAIQRIRLAADGKKVCRMMLGSTANCAVKLDPDEHVHSGVIICEGIETGLAARQMGLRPTWAMGSTGGISKLPLLPAIDALTIHAEPGQASIKAAHECARRWRDAGREVIVINSRIGSDLNDAIKAGMACA